MRIVLFEDAGFVNLLPLVYWRTVGELRCGAATLAGHVERACDAVITDYWVRPEFAALAAERLPAPINRPLAPGEPALLVCARYVPPSRFPDCPRGQARVIHDQLTCAHVLPDSPDDITPQLLLDPAALRDWTQRQDVVDGAGFLIRWPWDLLLHNEHLLESEWLGLPEKDGHIYDGAHLIAPERIRIEEGARILPGAVLDATEGPILIGRDTTVSPCAVIQGPACIGDHCRIQPGAVIRHASTIGPICKLGGEIEASIIHGHANKQHDGFLGHAYLGSWVNLGADTVNSDLKNTYGPVRVPINGREVDSGHTFVGMFLGDHAKTGIGQTFATGSVVGFAANVATSRFPPKFVPSFSWMTDAGREPYDPRACLAVARKVMARRNLAPTPAEEQLFALLPEYCARFEVTS